VGALAGLPFLALALAAWFGNEPATQGRVIIAELIYGAAAIAFLGGMRGGTAAGPYSRRRIARELSLAALLGLAAVLALLSPPIPAIAVLIAAFLFTALWDIVSLQRHAIPAWFAAARLTLAGMALIGLLAILAKLAMTTAI